LCRQFQTVQKAAAVTGASVAHVEAGIGAAFGTSGIPETEGRRMSDIPAAASGTPIPEVDAEIVVEIGTQNQGPEVLDLLRFPSPPLIPAPTTHLVERKAGGRTYRFRSRSIDDVVSRLVGQPANWITLERRLDEWQLPITGVTCTRVWAGLRFHPTYTAWSWTDQWPRPLAIRNFGDEASFSYEEAYCARHPDWSFPNRLLLSFALSMQGPVHPETLIDWLWTHLDCLDPRAVSLRPFGGAYDTRIRQFSHWVWGYFLDYPGFDEVLQGMTTRLLRIMSVTMSRPTTLREAHRDLGPTTTYKEIAGEGEAEPLGLLRIPLDVLRPFKTVPPTYGWFLQESVTPDVLRAVKEARPRPDPW
jgi:hypothetical protein